MAVDITGSTILKPLIQKTENQDIHAKNWAIEIVEITFGTNTGTSLVLSTATTTWPAATSGTGVLYMNRPLYCSADGMDATATGYHCAYGAGSVTITFEVAPTSQVIRFKIEGFA